jgi:hypothetical protein
VGSNPVGHPKLPEEIEGEGATAPFEMHDPNAPVENLVLLARLREAARAELDAFLAIHDACALGPPTCAALVRAWHALFALDALLRGETAPSAPDFAAQVRTGCPPPLPPELRDTPSDLVARVLACAMSDPGAGLSLPSDREFRRHRRLLLKSFASLDRRSRKRLRTTPQTRLRVATMGMVALLAVLSVLFALYRPRWRVSYYPNTSLSGAPVVVSLVRDPDRDWGFSSPSNGVPNDSFSARFETCLFLQSPSRVVFTVGSDDGSRLFIDDRQVLDAWTDQAYSTLHQSVALDRGPHRLRLEYYERIARARVSFAAYIENSKVDVSRMLSLPEGGGAACGR